MTLLAALLIFPLLSSAQINYTVHFKLEKHAYRAGEPVFCDFVIENTGAETFTFPHRAPTRVLTAGLESEPHFVLTDSAGKRLQDPAPKPCGGEKGTVVYGSTTLPPGQTSTERWLLNQWGRILAPGRYHVHAERHLPVYAFDPAKRKFSDHAAAYALAVDDLTFEVVPSTQAQLKKAYEPLLEALDHPQDPHFAEAVIAVTTVPHAFFEDRLDKLAGERSYSWGRQQAIEGLARLGTLAAWRAILSIALGQKDRPRNATVKPSEERIALRSYAILLLAEKADPSFLPGLFDLLHSAPEPLQQDVLRTLGFFHNPQANQVLFDRLHSVRISDRVNAILGLKNLNTKDAIPALLAMLDDSDEQVRQVANFALQNLTGEKIQLPSGATRAQLARASDEWHAWWLKHNATFTPAPQPVCRDW